MPLSGNLFATMGVAIFQAQADLNKGLKSWLKSQTSPTARCRPAPHCPHVWCRTSKLVINCKEMSEQTAKGVAPVAEQPSFLDVRMQ